MRSGCTISFYRNDLQQTRLMQGKCPVKACTVNVKHHPVQFQRFKGKMQYVPYCPEHGLRLHKNGFVYYNGPLREDAITAIRRNLMFHGVYYVSHLMNINAKIESGRLCYESSEDAVSFNVFTALLSNGNALSRLVSAITNRHTDDGIELYLWGGKIDLKGDSFAQYEPLVEVRDHLERDIRPYRTEPDIMLVIPKKVVICIEAKFGSKNPIAEEREEKEGEKPKRHDKLIERYCARNTIINAQEIFDFRHMPQCFYEQLFRNIVFAASMAQLEGHSNWFVVNLRNQHLMNLKRGKPESLPMLRNIRSMLNPRYKKRVVHMTWEEIYDAVVKGEESLVNLAWYFKNKSLFCSRAFNVI
jgi:Restriction Endonuclease associating with ARP